MEEGLDYLDLRDLGFIPEDAGVDDEEWFKLGSIRLIAHYGGAVDIYKFASVIGDVVEALVHVQGALPSTVYRQIIESVISAEHE